MLVIHRITLHATRDDQKELARLGVSTGTGLVTFELDESRPRWTELAAFLKQRGAADFVRTEASTEELAAADWERMWPAWHWSYPMPNRDYGYLEVTYDLSDYCSSCGLGALQKAPFRLRGEPKWGKAGILQLNWVFDEY